MPIDPKTGERILALPELPSPIARWICGERLGQHRIYAIRPMCVISRVTRDPI
jgi:hypothetical protein